jgi:hypothetical protein
VDVTPNEIEDLRTAVSLLCGEHAELAERLNDLIEKYRSPCLA